MKRSGVTIEERVTAGAGENLDLLLNTKSHVDMLIAHESLHPALINLLIDAAHEIHSGQGAFETPGEFPGTVQVARRIIMNCSARNRRRCGVR